jgi:V8-like Glu-specific endopeptidase
MVDGASCENPSKDKGCHQYFVALAKIGGNTGLWYSHKSLTTPSQPPSKTRPLGFAALGLGLIFAACAGQEETPSDKVSLAPTQFDVLGLEVDEAPEAFTDRKGNRWVKMRKITEFAPEGPEAYKMPADRGLDLSKLGDDELAEYWRPVLLANGAEYKLELPAHEFVAKLRRGDFYGGKAPMEPSSRSETLKTQVVIGNDDRTTVPGWPPSGLESRQMYMTDSAIGPLNQTSLCTGALVGSNTAISAAHCFVDPNTGLWRSTRHWAFGIATRRLFGGAPSQTAAFGNFVGCYYVTPPSGFFMNPSFPNDFSVIEFGCNLFPGTAVGAHGSRTASDTQINSSNVMVSGYPSTLPASFPSSARVPSLATHSLGPGGASTFFTGDPAVIQHTVDTTGGQSGASVLQNIFGGSAQYVTAIHVGNTTVNQNRARRFDGTVYGFLKSYTSY